MNSNDLLNHTFHAYMILSKVIIQRFYISFRQKTNNSNELLVNEWAAETFNCPAAALF
jgi:hypothetical protein